MRTQVVKSRNTVFFQWFVALEGRKVGSLKRRVRSQLASWEMKNCTPLWREAHVQIKRWKNWQVRSTFGSWDVEKVHAVVPRSTSRSQNVGKHQGFGPLLDVQMSFHVAGARDCAPGQKWAKHKGFVAFPKTMAGVGADFLREVAFWSIKFQVCCDDFAWQVQHFVWRGITFRGRRNTLDRWSGKIISSALNFPFLKEVSQNCFVFDVVNFQNEEASQNCFVFDVVKCKKWGSLAELLRVWCCQVQKLRKSRRIASFSSLQIDR